MAHLTSGVWAASITPLDAALEPRVDLLATHCDRLLDEGCAGVVVLGTTGEANSFAVDERKHILTSLLGLGIDPEQVIVGTGCCAAADTIALTKHALSLGVSRVLMLPPFYYKAPSEEGAFAAFARAIDGVGDERLRVYLYSIPQLSGVAIQPALVARLHAAYPRAVIGIKESSGDTATVRALCERFGDTLDVLAGNERDLGEMLAAGAAGCVSATANAYPSWIAAAYRRPHDRPLQARINEARSLFERYPLIAALKSTEAERSGDSTWRHLRPPLAPLPKEKAAELSTAFAQIASASAV